MRHMCPATNNEGEIPTRERNWHARVNKVLFTQNAIGAQNDVLLVFLMDGECTEIDPTVYYVAELDFTENQGKE